MAFKVKR